MIHIESIITELRIPDLPYSVSDGDTPDGEERWRDLLKTAWRDASDERVVDHLKADAGTWTLRQVNAAYLADRIMNVFLRRSGLHPLLTHRAARLRFWLALDLERRGDEAVSPGSALRRWLDSLERLQGWSRTGGRSDRWVLEHLQELENAVSETLAGMDTAALDACVARWIARLAQQVERARKVGERLWRTEKGAAGQRAAENAVRAALSRSCRGRRLPRELLTFLEEDWRQQMRSIALVSGIGSDHWRHANRLLEWLVWVGDPSLSDQDRNRLYYVCEQLIDKLTELIDSVNGQPPHRGRFQAVEIMLVRRTRNDQMTLAQARFPDADPRWLNPFSRENREEASRWEGIWYLRYEQGQEIRQFFFGFLDETSEVLWTNAQGAKLQLQALSEVREMLETGELDCLPESYSFGKVLGDTLNSLQRVLESQREQRDRARERARAEAQALRLQHEKAREEQARQATERLEKDKRELREAEQNARDEEAAAERGAETERHNAALQQVDRMAAGAWIEMGAGDEAQRLKLALRIGASGKLVFVDRYGLNRKEIMRESLMRSLLQGDARILNEGVEFAETLSRVTGRLRVGGNSR